MKVTVYRSQHEAIPLIRKRHPFRGVIRSCDSQSSFSADLYTGPGHRIYDALPKRYWDSVDSATYVVRSYSTPIAWWATRPHETDGLDIAGFLMGEDWGEWVVPSVKYSLTTTAHQSLVYQALGGYPWVAERTGKVLPFNPGWGEMYERVPCGTGR